MDIPSHRKHSTYIISSISMSFMNELKNGLTPFSSQERIEIIEILTEVVKLYIKKENTEQMPDFFTDRILKKYGHKVGKVYSIYRNFYFSREFVLLRFTGEGPGMIYTTQEFNDLGGHDNGQILTEDEYQGLLSAYLNVLFLHREEILLSDPEPKKDRSIVKRKSVDHRTSPNDDNTESSEIKTSAIISQGNDQPVYQQNSNIPDGYLDAKQACEFLHIKLPTLYANIKNIPHHKPNRKLLFSRQELKEYIKGKRGYF